jgi:TPR repeat protein
MKHQDEKMNSSIHDNKNNHNKSSSTSSSSSSSSIASSSSSSSSTTTTLTTNTTNSMMYPNITEYNSLDWDNYYHHHSSTSNRRMYHDDDDDDDDYSTTSIPYIQNIYWQQLIGRSSSSNIRKSTINVDSSSSSSTYPPPTQSLLDLDLVDPTTTTTTTRMMISPTSYSSTTTSLLERAAEHGHATAQYLLGNAYLTGFYYYLISDPAGSSRSSSSVVGKQYHDNHNNNNNGTMPLQVMEEWWYVPPTLSTDEEEEKKEEIDPTNESTTNTTTTTQTTSTTAAIPTTLSQQQEKQQPQQQQLQYQQARGMLWYQMAAIGGNVDAMITLGHRLEEQPFTLSSTTTSKGGSSKSSSTTNIEMSTCQRSIPYYASAAHHIIDTLMNDPSSRGQIVPFQDKHVLYKIHVHGGNYPIPTTSVQESEHNKPYESMETIQFYKIKASTLIQQQNYPKHDKSISFWSMKQWWTKTKVGSTTDESSSSSSSGSNHDATATAAAYTLGRFYHLGARGITPNITLARQYYTAAAQAGHWEAAGQAGLLYFYNIGFDIITTTATTVSTIDDDNKSHSSSNNNNNSQNYRRHRRPNYNNILIQSNREEAYRLFQLGAPYELSGCLLRYQMKIQKLMGQQNPSHDRIFLCDSESLNGLGLIHLFGLSSKNITINIPLATRYFELARDQGNTNAAYNLAMMKLGWRTHYSVTNHQNNSTTTKETDNAEKVEDLNENGDKVLDIDSGIDDERLLTSSVEAKKKAEQLFPLKTSNDDTKDKPLDDQKLSLLEYKTILTDLASAAKNGHLLARHRLAMIYENGIRVPPDKQDTTDRKMDPKKGQPQKYIMAPDCEMANIHYKWIIDQASPTKAQRMRKAYLYYMSGNYADSLRYYLYLADMGYEIAQLNAAFLLEQGVCLGLNDVDCAKASVRLWKVVAQREHAEANMRVGDFYYYGIFRNGNDRSDGGANSIPVGPWGWIDYLIYPEKHLLPLFWKELKRQIINFSVWEPLSILDVSTKSSDSSSSQKKQEIHEGEPTCSASNNDGTCSAVKTHPERNLHDDEEVHRRRQQQLENDLVMAAHYYQLAADKTGIARAHFNLGFMYEWGLGLKQDFPLAKRQYDLAVTSSRQDHEADLPILLALSAMSVHEYFVKLKLSWEKYWRRAEAIVDRVDVESFKVEL